MDLLVRMAVVGFLGHSQVNPRSVLQQRYREADDLAAVKDGDEPGHDRRRRIGRQSWSPSGGFVISGAEKALLEDEAWPRVRDALDSDVVVPEPFERCAEDIADLIFCSGGDRFFEVVLGPASGASDPGVRVLIDDSPGCLIARAAEYLASIPVAHGAPHPVL